MVLKTRYNKFQEPRTHPRLPSMVLLENPAKLGLSPSWTCHRINPKISDNTATTNIGKATNAWILDTNRTPTKLNMYKGNRHSRMRNQRRKHGVDTWIRLLSGQNTTPGQTVKSEILSNVGATMEANPSVMLSFNFCSLRDREVGKSNTLEICRAVVRRPNLTRPHVVMDRESDGGLSRTFAFVTKLWMSFRC